MTFSVLLTKDATHDLEDLYEYISLHDSKARADHVLDSIEQAFVSLAECPDRGSLPKELLSLGIRDFREIFFKPYRIIYKTTGDKVYVMVIADGRRDLQTLLQKRLFRP